MSISCLAPDGGETGGFGSHDDSCSLAHVGIVIEMGILELSGEYSYVAVLKELDALLAGAGYTGNGEDGAYAAADEVGVEEVGEGITDDDGISCCCIGTT